MPQRPKGGVEVKLYSFFNPALDGGKQSMQCPYHFTPEKDGIHCIGGWVGPKASLDGCGKSCPHRDLIPWLSLY